MDVIHHRDSLSFSLSLSTWTTEYRRIRRIIFIYDGDEKGGGRTKGEEDLRRSLIGSARARARESSIYRGPGIPARVARRRP